MITYKAKIEATSDGKDVSGTYNVGSVWHDGKRPMGRHLSY